MKAKKKNERERVDVIDNDRFVWGGAGLMPQQRVDAWVPERVYTGAIIDDCFSLLLS